MSKSNRTVAGILAAFFLTAAFAPLANATTEPSTQGDVIINGAFLDATPVGHPQKLYCDPYNAADQDRSDLPDDEPVGSVKDGCVHKNVFVAYDWTSDEQFVEAGFVTAVEGGMRVNGNAFLQQHFAGTDAPDRQMQFFGAEITARAETGSSANFKVEIRTGSGSYAVHTVTVPSSGATVHLDASDFGLPASEIGGRSIRLWPHAGADIVFERVSVFATNAILANNIHVVPAGDDAITQATSGAIVLSPGEDALYTFRVGMAADNGDFLSTKRAWLCLYDAEQSVSDQGYPDNVATSTATDMCVGAYLESSTDEQDAGITRRVEGDAIYFDVDADKVTPPGSAVGGAFAVYAVIEVDEAYDDATTTQSENFRSGYLHVGRLAADAAGAGVSREFYGPTPVFVDADADGTPDSLQVALAPPEKTGTRFEGDVTVNGAFDETLPVGHPEKFYSDPLAFVAYDWTAPAAVASGITPVAGGGLLIDPVAGEDTPFIQQHFNGANGPDRMMAFHGLAVTANSSGAAGQALRVEFRYDADGVDPVDVAWKRIPLTASSTRYVLDTSDLGLAEGGVVKARSIRIWFEGADNTTVTRVEVHGKNGISPKNNWIEVAGDDELDLIGASVMHNPGTDGVYTWIVRTVDDLGHPLLIENAVLCVYGYEDYPNAGFSSVGGTCEGAILPSARANDFKTITPEGIEFNVPVEALDALASRVSPTGFVLWASVELDGYVGGVFPTETFRAGFFNVGQTAAVTAHAGGAAGDWGALPTPVLFDRDGDGLPDYVEVDEIDGYAVIITPQNAVGTPAITVVAPTSGGDYVFDVEVYEYAGAGGAALDLTCGLEFGLFDESGPMNGGGIDSGTVWLASDHPGSVTPVDDTTCRVRVPVEDVPANAAVGAYAFYDVHEPLRSTPYQYAFGPAQSAFDFYGYARTAAKDTVIADALRVAATPLLLAPQASQIPASPTLVIRMDAATDELTPLDGTVVVSDGGDGTIAFEYAMFDANGLRAVNADGRHLLALYDAGGIVSDDLQPGAHAQLEHAEWTGAGTLTADGWFRVEVPVEAFAEAQGPVGAWAWIQDQTVDGPVGRTTWYNVLKETVASIDTDVAEKTLYAPTPIVLLDEQLGIPATLASALQGLGSGVFSISNPLVNPGFEADLTIEGRKDTADNTGATMTSPPWFFRLDDGANGGGQPTNPRSTHEVVAGAGRLQDSALRVQYNTLDNGKGLMLGQLLGVEDAGAAFTWMGASAVGFDVRTQSSNPLRMSVVIRWLNETGDLKMSSVPVTVQPSAQWQRIEVPMAIPATGQLLGLYLSLQPTSTMTFYIDNVAIEGSQTALGDTRSDLSDGYAMIIEPQELTGPEQGFVTGAGGLEYYLYDVTVVDFTDVAPRALPTSGLAKVFGLRAEELAKGVGTILPIRGVDDKFTVALPVEDAPGTPAAPWAWVDAGDVYTQRGLPFEMQPASGYYSPLKNALRGATLADSLDYAGTPVTFGGDSGTVKSFAQEITLVPVAGGYGVVVKANSPYVETTTLTVTSTTLAPRTFPVTLASANGDMVPDLVLSEAELQTTTLSTEDSVFTTGATVVAGDPIAIFQYCRQGPGCSSANILSGEALVFQSHSVAPSGETFTHTWNFNGTVVGPLTQSDVVHTFTKPGLKTVTLTVETASGKTDSSSVTFMVNNRAPTIRGIDITPTPAHKDSEVRIGARVADPDGGSIQYTWRIDGTEVPFAKGASFVLNATQILATMGPAGLQVGTYNVSLSVVDGQGSEPVLDARDLVVVAREPSVEAPLLTVVGVEAAEYALVGETVNVAVLVSDPDAQVSAVELRAVSGDFADLTLEQVAPGIWTGEFTPAEAAVLSLKAVATTATTEVAGAAVPFEVREDAAPVVLLDGPSMIQSGESATFVATAFDPDNRTLGAMVWKVDGVIATDAVDGTLTRAFGGMGDHDIEVTVDGVTDAKVLQVDDIITVDVEVGEVEPGMPVEVTVTVLDVFGQPVQGSVVRLAHFVGPVPAAIATLTATTDADGKATFNVGEIGGLVSLPVEHRVVATARAASLPGAPDSAIEQAQGEATWGVLGTLLP